MSDIIIAPTARIHETALIGVEGFTAADENPTLIHEGAVVAAGAVICRGVTVGRNATVAPGAVVTRHVPAFAIVEGNPASISSYRLSGEDETAHLQPLESLVQKLPDGAKLVKTPMVSDLRGNLAAFEYPNQLPFVPQRLFFVFDVAAAEIRGSHAHKECHQLLICAVGHISVVVDNGRERRQVELEDPSQALYIPPGVWATQYNYSKSAVLVVAASHLYDPTDYIRDYDEYLDWASER